MGFQQCERRGIKTLRLHQRPRRDPSFDEFVRHEQPQGLIRAAGRHAGVGEMNMGERFLVLGPALAGAPNLGEPRDASYFSSAAGASSSVHIPPNPR
jgi:hypothetical protein